MGIMKEIFKEMEKQIKANKPKKERVNHNKNKIKIQNIGYMRKGKYIHFVRINFNNKFIKNMII